jgi:hypothetical protein
MRWRVLVLLAGLGLAGALPGSAAQAIEPPAGSKNFTPPASVPSYFSNEAGAIQGRAASTGPTPVVSAPVPRGRFAIAARRDHHHGHSTRRASARGHSRYAHARYPHDGRHVAVRGGRRAPVHSARAHTRAAASHGGKHFTRSASR